MMELTPFRSVDEAWACLLDQRTSSHDDVLDLVEHQFQTAEQLEHRGCDAEMVVAGLFHDLGDGRVSALEHAGFASDLVRPLFGERVAWLIAAHADAKRYLCTVDPAYWDGLTPVSQRTMIEQGGLMTEEEAAAFAAHPWSADALLLRACDDDGKDTAYQVPGPERFRQVAEAVAASRA
jgi:predicted HD phosphohydrolase